MEIINFLMIMIIIPVLWILFAIILPYILLPNFLFREKIETNAEIIKIAKKLKANRKKQTLKNVCHYTNMHFDDYRKELDLFHLNRFYELFKLHNYKVKRLLLCHRRRFMWCYAQVKVLLSLLKSTGQFSENEMEVKINLSPHFSIHQYALISFGRNKIKIDPFYNIFKDIS